jgi:hypothetical protein
MYHAATREHEPELVDTAQAKERLREGLSRVGYEITASRDLFDTLATWRHDGLVDPETLPAKVQKELAWQLDRTRTEILPFLDITIPDKDGKEVPLTDFLINQFEFRVLADTWFTGSSTYTGGVVEDEGRPAFKGLFEYNAKIGLHRAELKSLCTHEGIPGHYMSYVLADLLWRQGKLGFEATLGTMCTPSIALMEGTAQNSLKMIYGIQGNVVGALGRDYEVEDAAHCLHYIAKHNASVLYYGHKRDLDAVRTHLRDACVQSRANVRKLSGLFLTHPIMGTMYLGAYLVGHRVIDEAIRFRGHDDVNKVGLYTQGIVDIETFQYKLGMRDRA